LHVEPVNEPFAGQLGGAARDRIGARLRAGSPRSRPLRPGGRSARASTAARFASRGCQVSVFQIVASVAEFPEDRWDALVALLLTSPFLLARCAWETLAASGEGRFLAIASVHGLVASPFKAGYVSAKHGLLGLVKTLALEGAPVGISACAVCPGYVRAPLVETQIAAQARAQASPRSACSRT
jgi:3-hydroxybutyrate dehydrogenase